MSTNVVIVLIVVLAVVVLRMLGRNGRPLQSICRDQERMSLILLVKLAIKMRYRTFVVEKKSRVQSSM